MEGNQWIALFILLARSDDIHGRARVRQDQWDLDQYSQEELEEALTVQMQIVVTLRRLLAEETDLSQRLTRAILKRYRKGGGPSSAEPTAATNAPWPSYDSDRALMTNQIAMALSSESTDNLRYLTLAEMRELLDLIQRIQNSPGESPLETIWGHGPSVANVLNWHFDTDWWKFRLGVLDTSDGGAMYRQAIRYRFPQAQGIYYAHPNSDEDHDLVWLDGGLPIRLYAKSGEIRVNVPCLHRQDRENVWYQLLDGKGHPVQEADQNVALAQAVDNLDLNPDE